ncbi:MAG: ATP-binding protein [Labrys sp. (in: a-proteobacteria)]
MMALGKLVRTTAFKLMAAYLVVFVAFAAGLLSYFAWSTERLLFQQINMAVDAELDSLGDQYRTGGVRRLAGAVDRRARQPGSMLYLVTTFQGTALAGNITELPAGVLGADGWVQTPYTRFDETAEEAPVALVRVVQLPGGFRLLVGRDLSEQQRVRQAIGNAVIWSVALVVVMGLAGALFVARRVLKRLDDISQTSRSIIEGDLTRRLAITGADDEIDRLAATTNAMLDRINELMAGLKEVSDNIAHDLKTPLTRLRNRVEETLRTAEGEAQYRATLEATIEESDGLIRTFNALLMIARAEAGQLQPTMARFDLAEVARDVADLYEPVAEEAGVTLKVEAEGMLSFHGNRELVSQVAANLVENALKHGLRPNGTVTLTIRDKGETVEMIVADDGEGIPVEDRQRVVERFVRLESSRSRPGSGLGLSLAAAVAKLHGGELRLEDNGPGLRAVILLPKRGDGG